MNVEDFKVGKVYAYSLIEEAYDEIKHDAINHEFNDYGDELLGKNTIHIRYIENKKIIDLWFVSHSNTNQFNYKCVYKE